METSETKPLRAAPLQRLVLALRARWQCFRSGGHALKWVRNIYGDEINARNGMRSEWKCTHCGSYQMRPELLREDDELTREADSNQPKG